MRVQVTLPVYNEERDLPVNAVKLHDFLKENLTDDWHILIVDNASTDGTRAEGERLSREYERIRYLRLEEKGRGVALKEAWSRGGADTYSFMDIDLSTDIKHFPALIEAVKEGYDIATGSRYATGAHTTRSLKRRIISRTYLMLLWLLTGYRFTDTQCGFKAVTQEIVDTVLPDVKATQWFIDTELLVLARNRGYKVKDVPVEWVEDPDTRVNLIDIITEFLAKTVKLRLRLMRK